MQRRDEKRARAIQSDLLVSEVDTIDQLDDQLDSKSNISVTRVSVVQ